MVESIDSTSASNSLHVVIVGAGPSGCLLALLLSRQGWRVDLCDMRLDPRNDASSRKRQRSINLALSTRALTALESVNLLEKVFQISVPMHGRCIHSIDSQLEVQPYGQQGQFLLSIGRAALTECLVTACAQNSNINLLFSVKCIDVDLHTPAVTFQSIENSNTFRIEPHLIVGADGTFSRVRAAMLREDRFSYSQDYVPIAYKEITMKAEPVQHLTQLSSFPVEYLHIWPRHRYMLIALPNDTKSFTCTLFMDRDKIEALKSPDSIELFFRENFPDAVPFMPTLVEDFCTNPTSSLLTVRCSPYCYENKAVVIGDAAHAIVPFYGQGCNAAFEDSRLLADALKHCSRESLGDALQNYSYTRKRNAEAIADLALDHYHDMSSRSVNRFFVFKRKLEILANWAFRDKFLPLYSMISFSNIPYADAVERAAWQDRKIEQGLQIIAVSAVATAAICAGTKIWRSSS